MPKRRPNKKTLLVDARQRMSTSSGKLPDGPKKLRAEHMLVTPEQAANWLEHNTINRIIKDSHVNALAEIMLRNEWDQRHPQTISIAADGTILDGQHRLWAILTANMAVWMLVVFDVDKDSFVTIDEIIPRTGVDALTVDTKVNGIVHKHKAVLASAGRLLHCAKTEGLKAMLTKGRRPRANNAQILQVVKEAPELTESVDFIGNLPFVKGITKSACAFFHVLFAAIDTAQANAFMTGLYTGENLSKGSPILALRNKLMSLEGHAGHINEHPYDRFVMVLIIKAWNAYRKGRPAQVLSWGETEEAPLPK